MSAIVPCLKLLIPIIILSISMKTEDKIVAQITGLVGSAVFLFSFLFLPLWIKLIIVSILYIVWLRMGDDIIMHFYRKFRE